MSEAYVFGIFFCTHPLPQNKTANRLQAKFRSQAAVRTDLGLKIVGAENTLFELTNVENSEDGFSVSIVYISDLEYQLKNTDPVDDQWRIRHDRAAPQDAPTNVAGVNARIEFTYQPQFLEPSSDNPNEPSFTIVNNKVKTIVLPIVPFAEERLELGYDYGAVGGPSFATTTVKVGDGRESRNSDRVLPLHRFQLGDRMVADSERDLLDEVTYLKSFHAERKGSYEGFRYKDWADYQVKNQYIATGDGVKTSFQLRKAYAVGDAVTYRPIQKPAPGTVKLFVDGVDAVGAEIPGGQGWTVNHETGIMSNPEPLPNGAVLSADFEFDVPVRFESDAIGFSLQAYDPDSADSIYRLESLFVTEIRLPLILPWEIAPSVEITETLDLGIIYDTIEQYDYSTERIGLRSGWDTVKPNREDSKLVFNLGDRTLTREEVGKLLAFFWNAKGEKAEFLINNLEKNYKTHFEQNSFNLKFLATNKTDNLFELSNLKLKLKEQPIFRIPPLSLALEPLFINPENPQTVESSGNSKYTGILSSSSGSNNSSSSYSVFSYTAASIEFDRVPPGSEANANFFVSAIFWAQGTLHLLVSATRGNYEKRLALYSLDLSNGWNFVYNYETSEFLREYYFAPADIANSQEWGGVISYKGAKSAFGSGDIPQANGNLVIKYDAESLSFEFVEATQYNSTSPYIIYARHGDRFWLSSSGSYKEYPIGSNIYLKGSIGASSVLGFPYNNSSLETESVNNIWVDPVLQNDKRIIREGVKSIFEFFPQSQSDREIPRIYVASGGDGSWVFTVLLKVVCEDGVRGCDEDRALDLFCFFLKSKYDSPAKLIDIQKAVTSSSLGDAFIVQKYHVRNKMSSDRLGNVLASFGSKLIYYRAGSGYAINISSQLSIGSIKGKPACTPYGFAVIAHSGNLFSSNVSLAFVQNQKD